MKQIDNLSALRAELGQWRRAGQRIAFVPTMGNLHAGHLALVRAAAERADRVVASIFVNPTQFGPNEDFARYPRTPERDAEALAGSGCDLLFLPTVETIYPLGLEGCVHIEVPGLSDVLCGAHRPGHFAGVATVVTRLLNMVQPDLAVFGRKDLQQLELIRHLVLDLAIPVEIFGHPTQRESDGLALSSRNQYLSSDERVRAAQLYQALRRLLGALAAGQSVVDSELVAVDHLRAHGFDVDYVVLRREQRLDQRVDEAEPRSGLVALAAARLGRTRLIDNLAWDEFSA